VVDWFPVPAELLGLQRTTLQSKMRKLKISRKDYAA